MRKQVLASFTKHVQPLLLNQCATAGCHGRNTSSEFTLRVPLRGHGFTRSQSITNLRVTMRYIDQRSPQSSRLLAALRELESHEQFLQNTQATSLSRLEQWVESFAPEDSQPLRTKVKPPTYRHESVTKPKSTTSSNNPADHATTLESDGDTNRDPYDPSEFNQDRDKPTS